MIEGKPIFSIDYPLISQLSLLAVIFERSALDGAFEVFGLFGQFFYNFGIKPM